MFADIKRFQARRDVFSKINKFVVENPMIGLPRPVEILQFTICFCYQSNKGENGENEIRRKLIEIERTREETFAYKKNEKDCL